MKLLFTFLLATSLLFFSNSATAQTINSAVPQGNFTDCSNTTVNIAAVQVCINYIYNGLSHTINGSSIEIAMSWSTPSPFCLGAISFLNPTYNLGNLPAGTYSVTVVAYLDGIPNNSASFPLTITPCCPVQTAVQGATNICIGDTVTLTGTTSNATNSFWLQNGNVVSTNNTLTLAPTAIGNYPLKFIANDGGCADTTNFTLKVNPYPVVNLGADTSLCTGTPYLLSGATSGVTSYAWNTGSNSPNLNVTNGGTYILTASINGCTDADTVVVSTIPTPTFNLGNNAPICEGTSVVLDATVNQTGAVYSWNTGANTPTITVSSGGSYAVTVTNSFNCSANDAITLTQNPLPNVNLGADTTLCGGETLLLDATGVEYTYIWSTGATSSAITVDAAGVYTATVTTAFGCSKTDTINVDYDLITFNLPDTLFFPSILDAGNSGSTYLWNTGATTQTIFVSTDSIYTVTVTNANGCMASATVVVAIVEATERQNLANVKCFPNPAQDFIIIETNDFNLETATIFNASGQVVKQVTVRAGEQIAVGDLPKGLYFVQLHDRNGVLFGYAKWLKS